MTCRQSSAAVAVACKWVPHGVFHVSCEVCDVTCRQSSAAGCHVWSAVLPFACTSDNAEREGGPGDAVRIAVLSGDLAVSKQRETALTEELSVRAVTEQRPMCSAAAPVAAEECSGRVWMRGRVHVCV